MSGSPDTAAPRAAERLRGRAEHEGQPGQPASDPLQLLDRPLVADVSRVQGRGGLEEEDVDLLLGHGPVLDAAGDDQELSLFQPDVAVAQLHAEAPAED